MGAQSGPFETRPHSGRLRFLMSVSKVAVCFDRLDIKEVRRAACRCASDSRPLCGRSCHFLCLREGLLQDCDAAIDR